ncbi:leucine-rich repeat domain-containing protein [Nonomuraea helvata]|uniref:Leucine-rich repeat domain-containing protein n=1 Tax=Nonomuraea helvata TaxID=37484 RepID=A0ABV5SGA4_9ACTN
MSDCHLDELPVGIGDLRALRRLDLNNGSLVRPDGTWVPPPADLWDLTDLEELTLPMSGLAAIPAVIGRMTRLRYLDLSTCEVRELPPELARLTDLERIDLTWTLVREVGPEVRSLPRLRDILTSRRDHDEPGASRTHRATPDA